ncbi:MAG: TonB-dependent receptor [Bryobacterales bacterium]|nr:TonB-dependent receptor [Bryobacterales bacterium]
MNKSLHAAALVLVWAGILFPQSKTSAELSGTVRDPSQAAVPKATITLTNADTGVKREAETDMVGEYRLLQLAPGVWDVKVEREGFTTQTRKGVQLTVGQMAMLDFALEVGAASQIIEVGAFVPLIESDRSFQANTIDQQSVRNLPINRRDYLTFALLAPGVSDSRGLADANNFRVKQTQDSGLSFYGSNGRGNNISVDGGESNDSGGGVRPTVSQEAVQEFQINRASYSAEHGSARGGVINIVTKSGGNQVRGSAFAFFRHQSLDAGDPFAVSLQDNRLTRVKPDSQRQQFGGTIGGPIKKDRTFYFLSYEQLRRRESATVPVLTDPSIFQPTAAQENILKALPAAAAGQLRAALSSPPSTVELFQKNSGIFPFSSDDHKGLLRLDHRFSDRDQVTFRYNVTSAFETNPNLQGLVGYSRGYVTDTFDSTVLAGWTRMLSPTLINDARAQFNYTNPFTGSNEPFGPALEIAGYGFFNRDRFLPNNTIQRRIELTDSLAWSRGSHALKFGAQALLRNIHNNAATFMSGRFTFGALPAALVNAALASTNITALQAFNLGLPQSYQQGFGDPVVRANYPLYAFYLQDAWKPVPNLTLNLGVRYEVDTRKSPLPTDKNNLSPRAGFAWDPFSDHKTIVRGGFGLFFAPIDFQIDYVVNALNEIDGYRQIAQVLTTLNAANPLAANGPINIFQTLRRQGVIGVPTPQRSITAADLRQFGIIVDQRGPRPPLTVLFRADPNYQNPYAEQGSFGIEREVAPGLSVSLSYVFVRGAKLTRSRDGNLLDAPVNPAKGIRDWGATAENPTGMKYFRDPLLFQENIYEATANSFYHGGLFEVTKRFARGVTLHANYTFSKAIDEVTDYNSDFQPNDQTNLRAERALSSFDQRHKFTTYAMFQTPHAKSGASAARKVAGGWSLTPILRVSSGRPFNLLAGSEINNDRHNTTDRPIFAGRNTGLGPNFRTFDSRLTRRIAIGERTSLDLLLEGFNVFNRLNYSSVNNTVGNMAPPFRVTGRHDRGPSDPLGFTSAADARRIQVGLRLSF